MGRKYTTFEYESDYIKISIIYTMLAQSVWLETDWTAEESRCDSPQVQEIFSVLRKVHTGSGAHPATYTLDIGTISPAINQLEREADYSLRSSVELRIRGSIHLLLYTSSWRGVQLSTGTTLRNDQFL
jgi:hypothetical protein